MYSYFSSSVSGGNRVWAETCVYLNKNRRCMTPLNIPVAGSSLRMPLPGCVPRFFYFSRSNYSLSGLCPMADIVVGEFMGCANSVWTWFSTFLCGEETPPPATKSLTVACSLSLCWTSLSQLPGPFVSQGKLELRRGVLDSWNSTCANFKGLFSSWINISLIHYTYFYRVSLQTLSPQTIRLFSPNLPTLLKGSLTGFAFCFSI